MKEAERDKIKTDILNTVYELIKEAFGQSPLKGIDALLNAVSKYAPSGPSILEKVKQVAYDTVASELFKHRDDLKIFVEKVSEEYPKNNDIQIYKDKIIEGLNKLSELGIDPGDDEYILIKETNTFTVSKPTFNQKIGAAMTLAGTVLLIGAGVWSEFKKSQNNE
jgi:hypothetical protein